MHNERLCLLFRFSCVFIAQIIDAVCKFIPLPQPMTSNPQSKPCDRFYSRYVFIKTNRAFSEDCHYPKKPGNTSLSDSYLSFFDIKQTVSTWLELTNISTGCTFTHLYPLSSKKFISRANGAGLHDT